MTCDLQPITYRAANGWAKATNEAVVAALGSFRQYCPDEEYYANCILSPAILNQKSKLLQLPDELLLNIALNIDHVDRNQDLRHLALTCRRLRGVAQEASIRTPVVTPYGLSAYLHTLHLQPEKVPFVSSIHLHAPPGHMRAEGGRPLFENGSWMTSPFFKSCHQIMGSVCSGYDHVNWAQSLNGNDTSSLSACLATLLVLLKAVDTLRITDTFIVKSPLLSPDLIRRIPANSRSSFPTLHSQSPTRLECSWASGALKAFSSRIGILEVVAGSGLSRILNLDFRTFTHLASLSVPARNLVYAVFENHLFGPPRGLLPSDPEDALPHSLETLKVQVGDLGLERGYLLFWLHQLARRLSTFSRLRHIQFQFERNFDYLGADMANSLRQSISYSFGASDAPGAQILRNETEQIALMDNLENAGITITVQIRSPRHGDRWVNVHWRQVSWSTTATMVAFEK